LQNRALITGITGQDGSYLAELLLDKGYEVHGIVRRVAFENPTDHLARILPIKSKVILHSGSIDNYASVYKVISDINPQECYHLAAQSFVSYSFEDEFSTLDTNIRGTQYILSAVHRIVPKCRFYFAASSEMFGKAKETPQKEATPFHPRSPYGISKVAGYYLTQNYREAYKLHASSGILFNHESPRRGLEFVTRKITSSAARIKLGLADRIHLGNLDAKRDWGHSREYVKAMWLMLQQDTPDDYVIASGTCHTVREFLEKAFHHVGLDPYQYLKIDENLFRPSEPMVLQGNAVKAKEKFGWEYTLTLDKLIEEMVENDLKLYGGEKSCGQAATTKE
jgi:GDPmannose 4,6-dehydratase